jgi:hypothetical protein
MEKILYSQTHHMTLWDMRITYYIPTATNTDSEYVTVIAFPLQQWLREGGSELHVHCPVLSVLSPVPVQNLRRHRTTLFKIQFTSNDFSTSLDVLQLVRAPVKQLVLITKIKRLNEEGVSILTVYSWNNYNR